MSEHKERELPEIRADTDTGTVGFEDPILRALLGGGNVDRSMAMQVPSVASAIDLISGMVAETPIMLYREADGKTAQVAQDSRLRLLNDETGDKLDANEFWRAMVADYFLGGGGYAYINRSKGTIKSLHYVPQEYVAIQKGSDPIFKDYDIWVGGRAYHDFDFLKILRNTRDGCTGSPITDESAKLIETAYQSLCYELYLVKKGGNKKGFLKAQKPLSQEAMDNLKAAFQRMYTNQEDSVLVLNNGLEFQESSNTSVEMQLNENKRYNASEFAKLFHVSTAAMEGSANHDEITALAKLAAIPLMVTIQCALNRDLLLEKEKGEYYFAFDTKELLKGDMASRYAAYKTALEANFMQIDEVRFAEDLEPLGLSWIKIGLQDVLYDPKTKVIYTPNTGQASEMGQMQLTGNLKGGEKDENRA